MEMAYQRKDSASSSRISVSCRKTQIKIKVEQDLVYLFASRSLSKWVAKLAVAVNKDMEQSSKSNLIPNVLWSKICMERLIQTQMMKNILS